ncbi:hypothetical protein P3T73_05005 [Kiritimatiellota bacterium B12222]|nr:hypothetical protein P3T73_05005 [Kiritimatiellota bacterium B12222]
MRCLLICFVLLVGQRLWAQELDDAWIRSNSARGRIQVMSEDGVLAQKVAYWSERSLKQLEREWRKPIPFQPNRPLTLVIHPDRTGLHFSQSWLQGVLTQTIFLAPDSLQAEPRKVAELFTQAMVYRMGLEALPPEDRQLNWEAPDWLIAGSAQVLLAGRSRELFAWLVATFQTDIPPAPEEIARMDIDGEDARREAAAALLCRWVFAKPSPDFWQKVAEDDFQTAESWLREVGRARNLRDLHVIWDLWWMQERMKLIGEYSLSEEAEAWLKNEQLFIPAFYGWVMPEVNLQQPRPFSGLYVFLDDPAFELGMQEWILRLQHIRFRQSVALNEKIDQLQKAGTLSIQASQEKGRKRDRLWEQALEVVTSADF